MVDLGHSSSSEAAIAPSRTKQRPPRPAAKRTAKGAAPRGAARKRRRATRRPARRERAEQPLGVGVADAFAVQRLQVPPHRAPSQGVLREIGWAEFGDIAKELADRIAVSFRPEIVLGVVNGGVFLGGALAAAFRAEFHPVDVERKGKKRSVREAAPGVRGKVVLLVDDVMVSGATMRAATRAARRGGAREVRSATLVVRPGRHRPDFHAIETDELVLFGWDYGLVQGNAPGDDPGEAGV